MPAPLATDLGAVRDFVVEAVVSERTNLAAQLQRAFGVSRPTAHNYLNRFLTEGLIVRTAPGRYELGKARYEFAHQVKGLEEGAVWADEIRTKLDDLAPNVVDLWHYGCTEMINNVIDHSESVAVGIELERSARNVEIAIIDSGVGIFRKIATALRLEDERHAVLELSKGKVTTDPANHTGEGIFFSSRAFDSFRILSGGVYFHHEIREGSDWILGDEQPRPAAKGTTVIMQLGNNTARKLKDVFDAHATDSQEFRFDRTVVPVKLLEYGDDRLVSRSQAKRLLTRFERFRTVILDFESVESVGQAFADEVFRVFPAEHPTIELLAVNTNEQVARMMNRAVSERQPQADLFSKS
jgi:hypothetical protein